MLTLQDVRRIAKNILDMIEGDEKDVKVIVRTYAWLVKWFDEHEEVTRKLFFSRYDATMDYSFIVSSICVHECLPPSFFRFLIDGRGIVICNFICDYLLDDIQKGKSSLPSAS